MEDEGIGLVLARATELRFKISNCINRATANGPSQHADDDDDDATERLLNICDALEALETQLSSLQVLQQQQRFEREMALTEIENSRKMLIDKLKEYKGKELDVIHEASTFASEKVEPNNDLLLPPYPSRPPYSASLDKEYLSQIPSVNKSGRNGLITLDSMIEAKKSLSEKGQNHVESGEKNSRKGLGAFMTSAAKTMLTVVGVVSIVSLSGFGPNLGKLGIRFSVQGRSQSHGVENENKRTITKNESEKPITQCPPGRILVLENGEARCLVKERVEIPFSAVAATPDINYGCG
ncbi:plastid division protein PDV2 [Abrus precatorius]|uniref:Plastid division protein PDV2 n=1 Tax=Abrus precatorius TaxID=3816 RepID=A0A8B8LI26_ABRPR|nr:plastid division protein PDV2 [Abrus precatorius]XP_027354439.1 plastid division protein PDV2 [Abrus precatorius]XP_027354440.1 plastid division protein PDV2 [Abrus precatorius]